MKSLADEIDLTPLMELERIEPLLLPRISSAMPSGAELQQCGDQTFEAERE